MSPEPELHRIKAAVHGRYLLQSAEVPAAGTLVGFHGFGESAEINMSELQSLPGLDAWNLVSVEALHPFYTRSGRIVCCWMTSQDRELAIAENIAWVRSVLGELRTLRQSLPMAVLGFSQGTAMAYRAAVGGGVPVAGVVALGGDVPPELAELEALPFDRVLIGRGRDEDWYHAEKLEQDRELLGALGVVPTVFEYDGGHEWTDDFRAAAADFLRSLI